MSNNPLRVSLENIIPLTEARDHFSQIVNEVQKDKLYVLTKGGKPAVAIIDVKYLEQITGGNVNPNHVEAEIQKNPAKVGRTEMISHTTTPTPPPLTVPSTPISAPTPTPPTNVIPHPTPPAPPTPAPIAPPVSKPIPEPPTAPQPSSLPPSTTPTPPPPALITPDNTPKPAATIEMHPMADIDEQDKSNATQSDNSRISPDDKPNPAQYSSTNASAEPDDMIID